MLAPQEPDPNRDGADPMVQEHWALGEAIQDRIREAGFESESVEGIAVDVHDLLQAADRIRDELGPKCIEGDLAIALEELRRELEHVGWHVQSALAYLERARLALGG